MSQPLPPTLPPDRTIHPEAAKDGSRLERADVARSDARPSRVAACFCLHDDIAYLQVTLDALQNGPSRETLPCFAFVSRLPWHDQPGDWQAAAALAESAGCTVVLGDWNDERLQRQAAIDHLLDAGFTHALIPDGDEIIEPGLLQALLQIANSRLAERVYVHWDTYWKSPEYVIRPREPFTPCYLLDLRVAKPVGGRHFEGGRPLLLPPDYGIVHHLSWVGPGSRIDRKLATWGHAKEVLPAWRRDVWDAWDNDRTLRNLHPTHPAAYQFTERIQVPGILAPAMQRYQQLAAVEGAAIESPALNPAAIIPSWPSIAVVIPLCGGEDDIRACLQSLAPLHAEGLLASVIVVDNASPDGAADVAASFPFVTLLTNDTNTGFAAASNQGADMAMEARAMEARAMEARAMVATSPDAPVSPSLDSPDLLLYLNADTIVPRAGLLRLVEALLRSRSIAAAGPWTNRAGHGQQLDPTYTSEVTIDLFAQDFAQSSPRPDEDVDMLVGFCLLVRRDAWEEAKREKPAGETADCPGFDERFGLGTFEDNDLCYRLRRIGWRLVRAGRAFVHHAGSKTLIQVSPDVGALLTRNERLYREKWKDDLEGGFASHLSGMQPSRKAIDLLAGRIVFDPERHPDLPQIKAAMVEQAGRGEKAPAVVESSPAALASDPSWRERIAAKAATADVSLCMIVKNEERVLGDCLASAKPYFRQVIVVDTGSTDRTTEIIQSAGAQLRHFPWTDSFADARNQSLIGASGRWIFWLDADDTLTPQAGEAILDAALSAPPDVVAFVVPVQFVDQKNDQGVLTGGGTRVDHVKLFRNLPGLAFEGRIHEQILPSLRAVAGPDAVIARAPAAAVVLHSGYDVSIGGQAKKRERDAKLLMLDLTERPDHPFVLFNLGMTDHYGGEHEGAVKWLSRCIEVSGSGESHVRKAWALKAVSRRELGDLDAAIADLLAGLESVGPDPELHFQAAYTLAMQGRWEQSRFHYERALNVDTSGWFTSYDIGIQGFKALHNLGQVCLQMNDYGAARHAWLLAIDSSPGFLPSAFDLFDAARKVGDLATAGAMLQKVEAVEGRSVNWPSMALALVREMLGKGEASGETSALPLLEALADAGVAEAAFYREVAATRSGELPLALSWMERALSLDPSHAQTREQVDNLRRAIGQQRTDGGQATAASSPPAAVSFREDWFDARCADALERCADRVSSLSGAIVEIGCWEGKSTILLANAVYPEVVHAIDHWRGNLGEGEDHPTVRLVQERTGTGSDVFARFVANVAAGTRGNVEVHRMDSADFFAGWGSGRSPSLHLIIKLAHIDGSHDYDSVKRDIESALALLTPGGIICGHDIDAPGVRKAVEELLPGFLVEGLWVWQKSL